MTEPPGTGIEPVTDSADALPDPGASPPGTGAGDPGVACRDPAVTVQNRPAMLTWYTALKTVHILLAITAVGANLMYVVILARAKREPDHLLWATRTVAFIDTRVATP